MDTNLVLLKKNGSHKMFPLPSSVTVIGRRHNCDLRIPLMSVSRRHCQLSCDNGTLKIRNLSAGNSTYVNGKRVKEAAIQAGDTIKVGPLTFVIQIDGQPQTIAEPSSASLNSPRQDAATENIVDDQLDNSGELVDDLDSLEETGSA
jgi:pSer/pThr/pTyr-binding forkhead associated (FHA) protein